MGINSKKKYQRIMAIDYLKGIAVILVILTHALSKKDRLKIGGPFWISMGVPIFMIISGFTNSLSADKNKVDSLRKFYTSKKLIPRLTRILWPYFIVVCLELLIGLYQKVLFASGPFLSFKVSDFIRYILTGGTTPGSYYILILLQFIIVFPLMHVAYNKSAGKSIGLFFSLHLIYDVLANYLPISSEYYRVLIFRYLAFIIVGIALYYSYPKLIEYWQLLADLSFSFIGVYAYLGYVLKVFSKWINTSLPTVFWALALVIMGMKYLEKENTTWMTYLFSRMGQASYQIFLIQKLLFGFGLNRFLRLLSLPLFLRSVLAIAICCLVGVFFHDILSQKVIR